MKLIFKNKSISKTIKNMVKNLIEDNKEPNENISNENIPSDEVEDCDASKSMTKDADEIGNVSQNVCGAWNQIICAAATTIIF